MGCICRPTRSISTHTHLPRPPPVAQVQDQRPGVCIPLSVPRVFTRVVKDSRSILAPQQGTNKPISRRLDYFCPISIKNPESDSIRNGFSVRSRVHCKQVSVKPNSVSCFPGCTARPSKRSRDPYSKEGSYHTIVYIDPQRIQISFSNSLVDLVP